MLSVLWEGVFFFNLYDGVDWVGGSFGFNLGFYFRMMVSQSMVGFIREVKREVQFQGLRQIGVGMRWEFSYLSRSIRYLLLFMLVRLDIYLIFQLWGSGLVNYQSFFKWNLLQLLYKNYIFGDILIVFENGYVIKKERKN